LRTAHYKKRLLELLASEGGGLTASPKACSNTGEYYQILEIESSAPDDGRKHLPKHVELTRNNKLAYIVASCWYF
jgi:hypothetical protein